MFWVLFATVNVYILFSDDILCSVFQGSKDPITPPSQVVQPDHTSDHCYASADIPTAGLNDHSYQATAPRSLPRLGTSTNLEKDPSNYLGRDFTIAEVRKIAASLNNGKAFGWDNIPSEFLKNARQTVFDI